MNVSAKFLLGWTTWLVLSAAAQAQDSSLYREDLPLGRQQPLS